MRIHNVTIDMAHPEKEVVIELKRGDSNMHRIVFTVLENGAKFDFDGFFAGIKGMKPDGKAIFNSCQPEGNLLLYDVSKAMAQELGEVNCELIFFKVGNEYISSPTFLFRITDNAFDEEDVISEEDLKGFQEYMQVSKEYSVRSEEYATMASGSATEAADGAREAATSAQEAADSASAAATSATNAEAAQDNAEVYRGQANAAATNAFNYMNSASSAASSAESNATAAADRAREAAESTRASANSASAAANSASAASVKASAAETSATAAANSASTATEKANSAGTAAGTAVQKAAEAEASADSAARSAENAATSEETATSKANAAATSASTASAKASEASNSASAAATSEANAAASAETATAKASEAAASASTASTKASEAEKSATSAGLAAAAAAQYAGQLESSADAAATSEANAAASAETATAKASAAASSASTASTKASAASNSESASANSASAAANSASAAEESATEAASSATAAANSASAAETSATEAEVSAEQAKNYYENLAQSGNVTGVKGSEEASFRTGNVIITAENVGALPKGGNAASAEKAMKDGNGNVIADTYATKDIYKNPTGGITTGEAINSVDTYRTLTTLINSVSFTFQTATNPVGSCGYVGYESSTGKYFVTMMSASSISALNNYVGNNIGASDLEISFSISDINNFTEYDLDSVKIVNNKTIILYFTDAVEYESLDYKLNEYGSSSVTLWIYTGAEITPLYQNRIGGSTNSSQYTSWKESPALSVYSLSSEGTSTNWTKRMRLSNGGNMYLNSGGSYNSTGADYGEFWEWLDSNSNNEDRIGLFVALDGNKIKVADSNSDYILGAISANACIVGNADEEWQGKWLKDDFGRTLYETVEITDENGNVILTEQPILNPEYDGAKIYIPRSERQEWDIVGMFGVLTVIDNGTCEVNSYATVGENGTAVPADEDSINKYRVIKRISDNVIRILFK